MLVLSFWKAFFAGWSKKGSKKGSKRGPKLIKRGVQEGSKTGPKVWFLLSVLDGKHYCRGGNLLENENIEKTNGFMCKSEMCDFR